MGSTVICYYKRFWYKRFQCISPINLGKEDRKHIGNPVSARCLAEATWLVGAKFGPQIKCSASSTVFLLLPPEAVQIIRSDGVLIKEKILLSTSKQVLNLNNLNSNNLFFQQCSCFFTFTEFTYYKIRCWSEQFSDIQFIHNIVQLPPLSSSNSSISSPQKETIKQMLPIPSSSGLHMVLIFLAVIPYMHQASAWNMGLLISSSSYPSAELLTVQTPGLHLRNEWINWGHPKHLCCTENQWVK